MPILCRFFSGQQEPLLLQFPIIKQVLILNPLVAAVVIGAVFSGFVNAYPSTIARKVDQTLIFFVVSAVELLGLVIADWMWLGVAGDLVGSFGMTATAIIVLTLVQNSVA